MKVTEPRCSTYVHVYAATCWKHNVKACPKHEESATIVDRNIYTIKTNEKIPTLTEHWKTRTYSWPQMCWFVYWLNCSPLRAVWCLKEAAGAVVLTSHNDINKRQEKVCGRSKLIESDMSFSHVYIRLELNHLWSEPEWLKTVMFKFIPLQQSTAKSSKFSVKTVFL